MSTTGATLDTLLAELRELAGTVAPIAAHLAAIDAQLADLPQSEEVEALRADVEALKVGMAEIKAFTEGPPPIPERLKALERDVAAFKKSTGIAETGLQEGVDAAGTATDEAHRGMARGEAAPMILASEARTEAQLVPMRERIGELGDAIKTLGKVARENQSAVLLLTGVAALVLAGLVLILISAFGSPVPLP